MDERKTDSGKPSDTEDEETRGSPDGEGSSKSNESANRSQSSRASSSSRQRADRMRQEEASRMLREITSDPDMMDHVLKAAVNPQVARELARQADVAWRNIEALPGGFRALCQMHHNIQQPLWQVVLGQDDTNATVKTRVDQDEYSKHKNSAFANAQPMPNPWSSSSSSSTSTSTNTTSAASALGNAGFPNISIGASNQVPSPEDASMLLQGLFPYDSTPVQNTVYTPGQFASQPPAAAPALTIAPAVQKDTSSSANHAIVTTTAATATTATTNDDTTVPTSSTTAASAAPEAATTTTTTDTMVESDEQLMQRYATEMQQLAEMGINDQAKCLVALEAAKGDLFMALGILEALEQPDVDEDAAKR